MGNFATASRRESDPFPQPGLGAYKGTLWDPAAKIALGQVARNSNLKFGVRPREQVCDSELEKAKKKKLPVRFRIDLDLILQTPPTPGLPPSLLLQ